MWQLQCVRGCSFATGNAIWRDLHSELSEAGVAPEYASYFSESYGDCKVQIGFKAHLSKTSSSLASTSYHVWRCFSVRLSTILCRDHGKSMTGRIISLNSVLVCDVKGTATSGRLLLESCESLHSFHKLRAAECGRIFIILLIYFGYFEISWRNRIARRLVV